MVKKGMQEGDGYCLGKRPPSANYVLEGPSDSVTKPKKKARRLGYTVLC